MPLGGNKTPKTISPLQQMAADMKSMDFIQQQMAQGAADFEAAISTPIGSPPEAISWDTEGWNTAGAEDVQAATAKEIAHKAKFIHSWGAKAPTLQGAKRKSRIKIIRVGADVEEFLRDANGKPMPVIGLIGGTKSAPMPVLTEGYALQEDNVALEYNIPAAADKYNFIYSLMRIREEINQRVAKHGLTSAIEASMRFEKAQLQHPQARVFGCEPDFNVWDQSVNESPKDSPEAATLRTAGAHVHVSFTIEGKTPRHPEDIADMEALIMALDIHVGVPFVFIDQDKDRRKLYGRAGAFRPKKYGKDAGVEYRVLSCHWTRSPILMAYVYDQVGAAVRYCNTYDNPRKLLMEYKNMVYGAINEGDHAEAHRIMRHFHVETPMEM